MSRRRKPDPRRAVAYIRVSTSEQEIGPEAQLHAIETWCEQHGIELACEPFIDHGVSGGLDFEKRPGLLDAYDALKTYNAAILVVQKRDRLARNTDVIGHFNTLLTRIGCRVCDTERPPGDPDKVDPMAEIVTGIQDLFAKFERSMIRARTKTALDVKRRKGERVGTVPYGFRLASDGRRLLHDPREQKVVKLVRRLRQKGSSLREIAAELDKRGYQPRTGKAWYPTTIKKIAEYEETEPA